jgi:hypothetical protein
MGNTPPVLLSAAGGAVDAVVDADAIKADPTNTEVVTMLRDTFEAAATVARNASNWRGRPWIALALVLLKLLPLVLFASFASMSASLAGSGALELNPRGAAPSQMRTPATTSEAVTVDDSFPGKMLAASATLRGRALCVPAPVRAAAYRRLLAPAAPPSEGATALEQFPATVFTASVETS